MKNQLRLGCDDTAVAYREDDAEPARWDLTLASRSAGYAILRGVSSGSIAEQTPLTVCTPPRRLPG
jgi:hypothetical protein